MCELYLRHRPSVATAVSLPFSFICNTYITFKYKKDLQCGQELSVTGIHLLLQNLIAGWLTTLQLHMSLLQ